MVLSVLSLVLSLLETVSMVLERRKENGEEKKMEKKKKNVRGRASRGEVMMSGETNHPSHDTKLHIHIAVNLLQTPQSEYRGIFR